MEELSTSASAPSDTARLTRRIAAGEEAAFREFHERYFNRLYQFLLVVTRGQEHEAREALQQTLLRVVRHARGFESEDAFWNWLQVLGRSAARDAGRKQQRYAALLQKFALHARTDVGAQTGPANNLLRTALEESLAELDPEDRRLIEGKYLDGSTVKELSAHSGLTDKAVESRLLRLRRQLRERLIKKLTRHE